MNRIRLICKLPMLSLLGLAMSNVVAQPVAAPGYRVETLVQPSPFCGVHGLGIDADGLLYAGSVSGRRLYRVDIEDGSVTTVIEPPEGMADDMEFLPDGTLVWTSISQGIVHARSPGGPIRELATDLRSVNSIAYRESDGRLFVAQVFGGDGLWEVDPAGVKPPRSILQDPGGLNGFDIGPDGMIYGPLWFKHQVVRINPDNGDMTVIADGFHTPAAANFDSHWNLYVLDTGTGEVFKVNYRTGEKSVFVTLKSSLDNLAIDAADTLYISNMADNSIQAVSTRDRSIRTIVSGGLSCASSLSIAQSYNRDLLYVADVFALRSVEGDSGSITDISRAHAADATSGYTSSVAAGDDYFYTVSNGSLQKFDRRTNKVVDSFGGLSGIRSYVVAPGGNVVVLHERGSKLTRLAADDFNQQSILAEDLTGITGLAADSASVYLSQGDTGSIYKISINNGDLGVVAQGLDDPHAIAITPENSLVAIETGKEQLVAIDLQDGSRTVVATDIPLGRYGAASTTQTAGVAAGLTGAFYLLSDRNNAIYKISRQ